MDKIKQRKRLQQEALHKATLIQRSGMSFYCTVLEEAQAEPAAVLEGLNVMNNADGHNVRDIFNVGKLLLSGNGDQLALVTFVPPTTSSFKLTAWDWMDLILHEYGAGGGKMLPESNATVAIGLIPNNPGAAVYVSNLKSEIICNELEFLRGQGALPDRADDYYKVVPPGGELFASL